MWTKKLGLGTLRFDENSFFHTLLGFEPYWDYKPNQFYHLDIPTVYIKGKIVDLNITNKIHLKCDVINGSVVDGVRQPILYSFVLDKNLVIKFFASLKLFITKR